MMIDFSSYYFRSFHISLFSHNISCKEVLPLM